MSNMLNVRNYQIEPLLSQLTHEMSDICILRSQLMIYKILVFSHRFDTYFSLLPKLPSFWEKNHSPNNH